MFIWVFIYIYAMREVKAMAKNFHFVPLYVPVTGGHLLCNTLVEIPYFIQFEWVPSRQCPLWIWDLFHLLIVWMDVVSRFK